MRRILLATLALPLLGGSVFAQTTTTVPPMAPAASAPAASATVPGGAPGANSFTEAQARSRLEQNGYSAVSALVKNDKGVWRGTAMRNGATVSVGVDYKGDISTN